jgi:hypothetical protein
MDAAHVDFILNESVTADAKISSYSIAFKVQALLIYISDWDCPIWYKMRSFIALFYTPVDVIANHDRMSASSLWCSKNFVSVLKPILIHLLGVGCTRLL